MPTLSWLTRDEDLKAAGRAPYRLLEEDPALGYGDPATGNMLIQGDNLEALKALLPFYAGQVKCIYIDPPFNTRSDFPNYSDNVEHSIWLAMLQPRASMLRDLLSDDGTLVLHLDDNEISYAIVLFDEIFGRKNRKYMVTFKQSSPKGHKTINPGLVTTSNYIAIYSKNSTFWQPNRGFSSRDRDKRYASFVENFDKDIQDWNLVPLSEAFNKHFGYNNSRAAKLYLKDDYENAIGKFVMDFADRIVQPVAPDFDQVAKETQDTILESRANPSFMYFVDRGSDHLPLYIKNGKRWLFYSNKLKFIDGRYTAAEPLTNIWDDLLSNNLHNEGGVNFPKGKKPEALIKRVFDLFSNPGELVLDSFLGSGTTAAVANKMRRRYIGIEMGEQAVTHCAPRLRKVIDGEQGGVSKAVGWTGGGGFRFYRLGPPVFDENGRLNDGIAFDVLAGHVWFSETGTPWNNTKDGPLLGAGDKHAIALLYNGVLGDKRPEGGNVLTRPVLALIREALARTAPDFAGQLVVYGERSALTPASLEREGITFKQTPYDVKARR